jgi:comEA protein
MKKAIVLMVFVVGAVIWALAPPALCASAADVAKQATGAPDVAKQATTATDAAKQATEAADTVKQATSATGVVKKAAGQTTKININTADNAQLESLPGIGPQTAKGITEYRQAHGGFKSVEELKQVKGIGDKKYDAIKDLVTME